jgi:hypothetical protein
MRLTKTNSLIWWWEAGSKYDKGLSHATRLGYIAHNAGEFVAEDLGVEVGKVILYGNQDNPSLRK